MNKKLDYFRNKINDIGLCASIKRKDESFYDELLEIFKLHPDYPEKIENVIDVSIEYNRINPTKCYELQLIKNNQTSEAISYRKCFIKIRKDNDLVMSMRYAILDQILLYKNSHKLICSFCNSKTNDIQIDHIILFKILYDDFLKQNTITIPTKFDYNYFNSAMFKDEDEKFKNSWCEYHKSHASLRCLCKSCNLTRKKK
jgi:hypothetical protein